MKKVYMRNDKFDVKAINGVLWRKDPLTGKRVYFKKDGMVKAALNRLYK